MRTLSWEGCRNVRDLGGLATEDGTETRFRVVVRSDNATLLSETGWQALSDYGVVRIVDLRFSEEVSKDGSHRPGIEVVNVPLVSEAAIFAEIDQLVEGITDPIEWRRANYLAILERAGENFARAVDAVGEASEGTVLVHCAGGVDRTGLVSALLLRLAGVSVDTAAEDYAASGSSWNAGWKEWIDSAPDEQERRTRRLLSVIRAEAMRDVLLDLDREYGGAREYLAAGGARPALLDSVRERLRA